jgi:hypothetical protein
MRRAVPDYAPEAAAAPSVRPLPQEGSGGPIS